LEKIGGTASPEATAAIKRTWEAVRATKPEPRIFWDFVEQERNNVLKAYRRAATQNVTIDAGTMTVSSPGVQIVRPEITFEHLMTEGYFQGQDPLDLVEKAIEWWRAYLDSVDNDVRQSFAGSSP
jgi:hypothetical protein